IFIKSLVSKGQREVACHNSYLAFLLIDVIRHDLDSRKLISGRLQPLANRRKQCSCSDWPIPSHNPGAARPMRPSSTGGTTQYTPSPIGSRRSLATWPS